MTMTDVAIRSRTAAIEEAKLHYLIAGEGPALLLLHGYAETSLMWKPVLPALAERFTVIAPDLPGIGESDIPPDGLDMQSAAVRIHGLVRSLGFEKAAVVGHDIGLMVAYAYAAQFPERTERVVLMDAFLPGIGDWKNVWLLRDLCTSISTERSRWPWSKVANAFTSNTSGTTSPLIGSGPFRRPIADCTLGRMRSRARCGQALSIFAIWNATRRTLRGWRVRGSRCPCWSCRVKRPAAHS